MLLVTTGGSLKTISSYHTTPPPPTHHPLSAAGKQASAPQALRAKPKTKVKWPHSGVTIEASEERSAENGTDSFETGCKKAICAKVSELSCQKGSGLLLLHHLIGGWATS